MGNRDKDSRILRVIQDKPLPASMPERTYERVSGSIQMRDYKKEPLTEEEIKRIKEMTKPCSGSATMINLREEGYQVIY